ncbi:MAG: 3-hydroxyacyl-ACP dehydratase FabZ [Actinomycetota bacterium]|jgi:3-hydroxyacyl-[acyl-carrier-protein] dehydratase|nr:3-hydroxyacyl-[acyl-carrier-protein] dehydratase FabZ [Acidimicrobiaceae bacterium]MEE2645798.1 3-hydroxyacyl-ACP dehydratase FabZ [Actinomycetota bacterium]|tara:strand:+ start:1087 stop:1509 length:423 start_codon:yes stop_codon:yes gene_type:complete
MMPFPPPIEVIPHRPPFLFLTEVTALTPGVTATGYWDLTGEEDFFAGHFPDRPTLPGVLQCESIAQLGAYALLSDERFSGRLALFGGIDKVRFRRQVIPGDRLDLSVTLDRVSTRAGKGTGRATVNGERACECELFFAFS